MTDDCDVMRDMENAVCPAENVRNWDELWIEIEKGRQTLLPISVATVDQFVYVSVIQLLSSSSFQSANDDQICTKGETKIGKSCREQRRRKDVVVITSNKGTRLQSSVRQVVCSKSPPDTNSHSTTTITSFVSSFTAIKVPPSAVSLPRRPLSHLQVMLNLWKVVVIVIVKENIAYCNLYIFTIIILRSSELTALIYIFPNSFFANLLMH